MSPQDVLSYLLWMPVLAMLTGKSHLTAHIPYRYTAAARHTLSILNTHDLIAWYATQNEAKAGSHPASIPYQHYNQSVTIVNVNPCRNIRNYS